MTTNQYVGHVLDQVDAVAERRGMSRSGFLAHAAKREVDAA